MPPLMWPTTGVPLRISSPTVTAFLPRFSVAFTVAFAQDFVALFTSSIYPNVTPAATAHPAVATPVPIVSPICRTVDSLAFLAVNLAQSSAASLRQSTYPKVTPAAIPVAAVPIAPATVFISFPIMSTRISFQEEVC